MKPVGLLFMDELVLVRRYQTLLMNEKNQAINYGQNRASFRSGEIRIFNSTGDLERTIPFTEADRKL
jgi:hypothetical protein